MSQPWRHIVQDLTSELERQDAKLQDLELENQRLRIAGLAPMVTSQSLRTTAAASSPIGPKSSNDVLDSWKSEPTQSREIEKSEDPPNDDSERGFSIARAKSKTGPTRRLWYVINPQSNSYASWQLVTTFALAFVVTAVPYQVGLLELRWDILMMVSCMVDSVFLWDMVLQFFTMYPRVTARGLQWEDSLSKIATHYLKTWFPIDLITIIPFDVIELASGADHMSAFKGTKAIRALRLLKLMRVVKTSRWLHKLEIAVSIPYQQFALARFLLILLLVCHWLACVWSMTLQLADPGLPQWISDIESVDLQFGITTKDSPWRIYLTAFYFCSYTMTSVGYGDIYPQNSFERIVCILIILTAGLCWAYVLGEVCAIVSDMNSETQAFRKKMTDLNTMMSEQGLPNELRCRLRSFFLQNRHQALHVTRQRLRDSMSPQLQSEVCIALNFAWIQRVTFFSQFMALIEETEEKGLDADPFRMCIADISRQLDCGAFAQGERFDNVQVLYILSKGLVALNSRVGSNGAVWGEDFVLSDVTLIRPVRGFALTYLEVLFLTRAKFMKVIERRKITCPQLGQIVRRFCVRLAVRRGIVSHARITSAHEEVRRTQAALSSGVQPPPSDQLPGMVAPGAVPDMLEDM